MNQSVQKTELRFYVRLDTKQDTSETFYPASLLACTEETFYTASLLACTQEKSSLTRSYSEQAGITPPPQHTQLTPFLCRRPTWRRPARVDSVESVVRPGRSGAVESVATAPYSSC